MRIEKNRAFIRITQGIVSGLLFGGLTSVAAGTRPNVVFFIADDVNSDLLNYRPENAGTNALTPNLDRLAKEGTVLLNQQIPSPVCTPSRYSCLTGKYASSSASVLHDPLSMKSGMTLVSWNPHIMPEDPTLPKALRSVGYRTGMVGKGHFSWVTGMQTLPADSDPADPQVAAVLSDNYAMCLEHLKKFGFDEVRSYYTYGQVHDHPVKALRQHNMDWIAQGALDFLDECKTNSQPFYLYVATTIPHAPYEDNLSWNADPRVTPAGLLDKPCQVLPKRSTIPQRLSEAGLPFESFRAMMVAVDDSIGAILDKLKEVGQLDNTIFFFFNDNGQEGKGSIYESGVTCPSVVWRQGGFLVGHKTPSLVSNIDFAPTIAEWAGADVGKVDGLSFAPVLAGKVKEIRDSAYSEMGFTRAVRKGNWKYIALRYPANAKEAGLLPEIPGEPTNRPPFGHMAVVPANELWRKGVLWMRNSVMAQQPCYYDADQLYDLFKDPHEQVNLAANPEYAEKLAEMKVELQRYIANIPGTFGELKTK